MLDLCSRTQIYLFFPDLFGVRVRGNQAAWTVSSLRHPVECTVYSISIN